MRWIMMVTAMATVGLILGCGGGSGSNGGVSSASLSTDTSSSSERAVQFSVPGEQSAGDFENDSDQSIFDLTVQMLRAVPLPIDYYVVQFDGTDPLGWVAVSPNRTIIRRPLGTDGNGSLIWEELQGADVRSFVDVYFDINGTDMVFDALFQQNEALQSVVSRLVNRRLPVTGVLSHYAPNRGHAWVYASRDGHYAGLFDGVSSSGTLRWRALLGAIEGRALRETSEDQFDAIYSTILDHATVEFYDEYRFIMFTGDGSSRKAGIITPSGAVLQNGQSAVFSFSIKDFETGESTDVEATWQNGPTFQCERSGRYGVAAYAQDYAHVVRVFCNEYHLSIFGSGSIYIGDEREFWASLDQHYNDGTYQSTPLGGDFVMWSATNSAVASVSAGGMVTCHQYGTATITARSTIGGLQASKTVHCVDAWQLTLTGPGYFDVYDLRTYQAAIISKSGLNPLTDPLFSAEFPLAIISQMTDTVTVRCEQEGRGAVKVGHTLIDPDTTFFEEELEVYCRDTHGIGRFMIGGPTSMQVPDNGQYYAWLRNPDRNLLDVTGGNKTVWSTENPTIAKLTNKENYPGLISCLEHGTTKVSAYYVTENGETLKASLPLTCVDSETMSSASSLSSLQHSSSEDESSTSSASSGAASCSAAISSTTGSSSSSVQASQSSPESSSGSEGSSGATASGSDASSVSVSTSSETSIPSSDSATSVAASSAVTTSSAVMVSSTVSSSSSEHAVSSGVSTVPSSASPASSSSAASSRPGSASSSKASSSKASSVSSQTSWVSSAAYSSIIVTVPSSSSALLSSSGAASSLPGSASSSKASSKASSSKASSVSSQTSSALSSAVSSQPSSTAASSEAVFIQNIGLPPSISITTASQSRRVIYAAYYKGNYDENGVPIFEDYRDITQLCTYSVDPEGIIRIKLEANYVTLVRMQNEGDAVLTVDCTHAGVPDGVQTYFEIPVTVVPDPNWDDYKDFIDNL